MHLRQVRHVVPPGIGRRYLSTRPTEVYNAFIAKRNDLEQRTYDAPRQGLLGRHIAVKDNICTVDFPTTCASGILQGFVSPYDATVVQKLRKVGAVICGKTNMDEFGMGTYSTHSFFGPVVSVCQDSTIKVVGGSSGGSAGVVVMDQAWAALGTDTGGSVRMPAAMTGIYGFKPSYGLLSRWGVVAYANSLDTVGILAKSVAAIRLVFRSIDGYDAYDPTSLSQSTRRRIEAACLMFSRRLYNSALAERHEKQMTRPLRIGVPSEYNLAELSKPVRNAWAQLLEKFSENGHDVELVSLPTTKHALAAYYVIAPAEASSNLAKYDGIRYGQKSQEPDEGLDGTFYTRTRGEGFGAEVKRRILLGTYSLSSAAIDNYFIQAQRVRRMVQHDFDKVFKLPNVLHNDGTVSIPNDGVDILICPTAPKLPPTLSEVNNVDATEEYVNDVLTVPASLAGLPAISVPFACADDNAVGQPESFPVGMQIIGQFGHDDLVLDVAEMVEQWQQNYTPAQRRKRTFQKETKRMQSDNDAVEGSATLGDEDHFDDGSPIRPR